MQLHATFADEDVDAIPPLFKPGTEQDDFAAWVAEREAQERSARLLTDRLTARRLVPDDFDI